MSVTYLIAFDKKLTKTEYLYKDILKSKKTVFSDDDGIVFELKLFPQEEDIAKNIFQSRVVYSIRASVPLSCNLSDKENIAEEYYICEKEQLDWFKDFLKKHIAWYEDVLFIQIALGSPIKYSGMLSQQVDVNDIIIDNNFLFTPKLIYQFVNNKRNNI
ncbi:MAG: hypothetical protein PHP83_03730 [Clostridia bacterium]|nr:hypothetical protein [Clostridia bacterium]